MLKVICNYGILIIVPLLSIFFNNYPVLLNFRTLAQLAEGVR